MSNIAVFIKKRIKIKKSWSSRLGDYLITRVCCNKKCHTKKLISQPFCIRNTIMGTLNPHF